MYMYMYTYIVIYEYIYIYTLKHGWAEASGGHGWFPAAKTRFQTVSRGLHLTSGMTRVQCDIT